MSGEDFEEIFDDVLVGDVWIAAGQSNMEFPMFYEKNYREELEQISGTRNPLF